MKRHLLNFSVLLSLIFLASVANAQGFPWGDFQSRTLKDLVHIEEDVSQRDKTENDIVLHAKVLSSKVSVIYTGISRPISTVKKDGIGKWAEMLGNPPSYAENYESDYLFTEGGVEYWLPVQKQVSAYFPRELVKGDKIDIYLVSAGGIRTAGKWDWMFLVEEYQKAKVAVTTTASDSNDAYFDRVALAHLTR